MNIAADTSAMIAYFKGEASSKNIEILRRAIDQELLFLPPIVAAEILSFPRITPKVEQAIRRIPYLEITPGFCVRVGLSRSVILKKGFKARIADAMIAQCCIDNNVPLITLDKDFRHFKKYCDLQLV